MKYKPLPKEEYILNRKRFAKHLSKGALAIFNSNDIMPTNADGHMPFRQNNDLFYLTGVDQEETILLVFPEAYNPVYREILFVKETNKEIAIWEGAKLDKDGGTGVSGIKTVIWLNQFESILNTLMHEAKVVYLNSNEHTRAKVEVQTRDARFGKWLREKFPLHEYKRATPILHQLRSIKSKAEVKQMQTACNITGDAFQRILKFVKPGVKEYEIEAELVHEFLRQGSRGFAYTPIIASGFNACVLHYIENDKTCSEGDVILLDVGAEYANYCADMTRCIPVSGRFTKRQKDVYNAVLNVFKECKKILKAGVDLTEYHKEVGKLMEKELVNLKLLNAKEVSSQDPKAPLYKKYFMHGTSHYIGLDVHDIGSWTDPVQVGNVFTIEPGIYIREESLGIRLENDVLITEDGMTDLMGHIPIEAEEIEDLMN